ncbi:MAG: hypothetical protein AAF945_10350 [Actinomycetota bacterium]
MLAGRATTVWAIGLAVTSVLAASGCGPGEPYDDLSAAELAYLMPDAASWSPGDPCGDGGDCSGAIPLDVLDDALWSDVVAVETLPRSVDTTGDNVRVRFTVVDQRGERSVVANVHESDPARFRAALSIHDVLLAEPRSDSWPRAVPIAIDQQGRVAPVGWWIGAVVGPTITQFAVATNAETAAEVIAVLRAT